MAEVIVATCRKKCGCQSVITAVGDHLYLTSLTTDHQSAERITLIERGFITTVQSSYTMLPHVEKLIRDYINNHQNIKGIEVHANTTFL